MFVLRRVCLQLIALLCLLSAAAAEESKVKVGIILPLTGDAASVGEAIKNGIQMGYEKIPAAVRDKMELYYEDDALKPVRTISAYNKLLNTKGVNVVVNASSGTANALAPVVEKHGTPLIAIATDPEVVKGRKFSVNFWATPEEEIKTLFPEALKRGYKKIVRISSIQDAMLSLNSHFDKINNGRIKVVLDEEYPLEMKDFKTYLTKVKAQKDLDAIMVLLLPGHLGTFGKQARQMGIDLPIFGLESLEDFNEVRISQGALVGAWYVNADDPNNLFVDAYRKRFPEASLWGASNGHDLMLLIGAAIEEGGDQAQINKFLHTVKDFSGALGTYSATGDNRYSLPAAVKVVTKDGFRKLY